MNLPKSIRVAAFDIEIKSWDAHYGNDRGRFGEFSAGQQEIRIDQSLKPQKLLDTMFHELGHAIYWAYGMEDDDKEERIVSTFATAWTQIFRDNPDFRAWIDEVVKTAERPLTDAEYLEETKGAYHHIEEMRKRHRLDGDS